MTRHDNDTMARLRGASIWAETVLRAGGGGGISHPLFARGRGVGGPWSVDCLGSLGSCLVSIIEPC